MSQNIPERIYIYRSPKTGVMDGDWARDKSLPGDIEYIRAEAVAKEREAYEAVIAGLSDQLEDFLKKHTTERGDSK